MAPLFMGGNLVAMIPTETTCSGNQMRYFHTDGLGSVVAVTDQNGDRLEYDSYDAWGKRRNLDGSPDTNSTLTNGQTDRGYTGEEFLADSGLVHLNGRLYDPAIGRMVSADPMTSQPYSTQGWDRYSYVGNNPLRYTDPSGMCFLGCFWKPFFKSPLFRAVAAIAAVATLNWEVLPEIGLPAVTAGSTFSAATATSLGIEGAVGGAIATGTLKGALIGAVSAEAFFGAGSLASQLPTGYQTLGAVVLDGDVGGVASLAGGGSFRSGFLAAGFSALADPVDLKDPAANLAIHSVIGGVGAVLGGGKFENGAVTGAFGYMFSGAARGAARGENPLGDIAGKIWALPDTAIGLVVGSLDIVATFATTGELPQFTFGNNALQISNLHIGPAGGITFGNIELFTGYEADGSPVGPKSIMHESPYTPYSGFAIGSHEEAHTYQAQNLGPFFFPVYLLNGGVSASNPYETQADKHAATGASPLP